VQVRTPPTPSRAARWRRSIRRLPNTYSVQPAKLPSLVGPRLGTTYRARRCRFAPPWLASAWSADHDHRPHPGLGAESGACRLPDRDARRRRRRGLADRPGRLREPAARVVDRRVRAAVDGAGAHVTGAKDVLAATETAAVRGQRACHPVSATLLRTTSGSGATQGTRCCSQANRERVPNGARSHLLPGERSRASRPNGRTARNTNRCVSRVYPRRSEEKAKGARGLSQHKHRTPVVPPARPTLLLTRGVLRVAVDARRRRGWFVLDSPPAEPYSGGLVSHPRSEVTPDASAAGR